MASTTQVVLPRRTFDTGETVEARQRDRNGRKKAQEPRRRLVVEILPRPRAYIPLSGPDREPVEIVPPRDSEAYIIERILLPSDRVSPEDGKPLPKRMTYIIGWHTLPAARLLVSAMDVLDYVSPRELEDWETRLEQELEDERERLLEEQKHPQKKKKDAGVDPVTGKRKRGRPPANSQIEMGAVAELETEKETHDRLKGGALSLSTPQKNRLRDFEGLSDEVEEEGGEEKEEEEEEEEEDASPSRQIEEELMKYDVENAGNGDGGVIDDTDAESELDFEEDDITSDALPSQDGMAEGTAAESLGDWPSYKPFTSNAASSKQSSVPDKTPTTSSVWAAFGSSKRPLGNGDIPPISSTASVSPTAGPSSNKEPKGASRLSRSVSQSASVSASTSSAKPRVRKPRPKKEKPTSTKEANPKKQAVGNLDENGEEVWVVKRIEEHELFEVEGIPVPKRYFKVLWEGDWPPEQNPSWEPEENLPPKLVRNYLKTVKKRKESQRRATKAPSGPQKKKIKQTTIPWLPNGTQYGSVSEAFAGEDVMDDEMQDAKRLDESMDLVPQFPDNNDDPDIKLESEGGNGIAEEERFIVDDNAYDYLDARLDWSGTMDRIMRYGS